MASFSERYGYTKPSDVIIREQMPEAICNAIINWLGILKERENYFYYEWEKDIWQYYFNQRISDYERTAYSQGTELFINKFSERNEEWYNKLNLLEQILNQINDLALYDLYNDSINNINFEFERLNYAYRIIDGKVEEITSKEEIQSIEEAIKTDDNGVKTHLNSALEYLSASNKTPDYRNSIKESISAVETICRKLTGENDLGKALSQLEKKGITIQPMLRKSIENLYYYTSDKDTGIRHALIEDNYTPSSEEAIFMLVSCSAFINYLTKKNGQKQ